MSHHDDHHDGTPHLHVTPFWPMLIVFIVLLGLTVLTVWTAKDVHAIQIGNTTIEIGTTPHLVIALVIASVKSLLVLGFFMHLLYDKAVNSIILASTLFAITLFLGLTLMDFAVRDAIEPMEQGEQVEGGTARIVDKAKARAEASKADEEHAGDHEGDGAEGVEEAGDDEPDAEGGA